jgi:ferredoxin
MLSASGYTCRVRDEECVGCAECAEVCPFDALRMQDGLAVVDGRACMGCGVCVSRCPAGALALDLDPRKGAPLLLDALRAGPCA